MIVHRVPVSGKCELYIDQPKIDVVEFVLFLKIPEVVGGPTLLAKGDNLDEMRHVAAAVANACNGIATLFRSRLEARIVAMLVEPIS